MGYCFNKNDFHFTVADNGVSTLDSPSLGHPPGGTSSWVLYSSSSGHYWNC